MVANALQYSRTRLLHWRMAALWLLLSGALWAAAPGLSVTQLGAAAALLALAAAVLRLWDDLADVSHDEAAHPERVLVSSGNLRPFVALVATGLLILMLALLDEPTRLAVYCALLAGFALLYHSRSARALPRPVRACLVLAKYPVLVVLAGAGFSGRAWLVLLALYAALCVFEWRDDPELRAAPWRQLVFGSALGAAFVSLLFLIGSAQS